MTDWDGMTYCCATRSYGSLFNSSSILGHISSRLCRWTCRPLLENNAILFNWPPHLQILSSSLKQWKECTAECRPVHRLGSKTGHHPVFPSKRSVECHVMILYLLWIHIHSTSTRPLFKMSLSQFSFISIIHRPIAEYWKTKGPYISKTLSTVCLARTP